jgi:4-aminobutyrate aminotransferase/(S)-3-amino-2-methylpropionate transaminase
MNSVTESKFRNHDLAYRRCDAVARGVSNATSIAVARAANAEIWDVDGRRYIDFASGIAVLNTGHCHPTVMAAAREQMERFTHTCFQVTLYESYVSLAERLNTIVPIKGPNKSILLTTGAEAVENSIKIARAYTGRPGVIAFTGGFHGRTHLAMALTGKVVPYKKGVGPSIGNVWHAPFPDESTGITTEATLRYLDHLFCADIDPSEVAAIIVEPVQGEGGFNQVPAELMRSLRAVCDQHGIVLIADEIQTGFGRTGRMFAMEHFDVEADLICLAKSLGGGLPLSAVVGRADIMDAAEPGRLGGTFAGNPVACAAALAVLDLFADGTLLQRTREIGMYCRERLERIQNDAPLSGAISVARSRNLGAMIAFDIVRRDTGRPDPASAKALVEEAARRGLIVLTCGKENNSIRILVPLTAEDHIVAEGCDTLIASLKTLE